MERLLSGLTRALEALTVAIEDGREDSRSELAELRISIIALQAVVVTSSQLDASALEEARRAAALAARAAEDSQRFLTQRREEDEITDEHKRVILVWEQLKRAGRWIARSPAGVKIAAGGVAAGAVAVAAAWRFIRDLVHRILP